jgi:hypothetical protein
MAHPQQNNSFNKTISLAAVTAAVLLMFSFFGAPFVRVLATTVRSSIFWGVGCFLVATLFVFNLSIASIYVGAVWMTLGFYSELEKRGTSWKKTGLLALLAGLLFAVVCVIAITKGSVAGSDLVKNFMLPLQEAMKQVMPAEEFLKFDITQYLPGIFTAVLVSAIALSFIFEAKIFSLFSLKREKISSSMKWIEFRVPDIFIWFALFGFLFSIVDLKVPHLKIAAMNFSIFSIVVFFFQGISAIEFMTRVYRTGFFTKIALYMLILGWLGPAVSVVGLLDYWVNFRKMVRKKIK